MRYLQRDLLAVLILFWAGGACSDDAAKVRLGFLINFARYVEWPASIVKQGGTLRFCLAPGDAEMAARAGEIDQQSIQGHPAQVRLVARPADTLGCHLLFLPADSHATLPDWLGAAKRTGALTVGDVPDFIERGGMIGLVPIGGRYNFELNLGTAMQADLRFSSQLLKLARTIK